MSALFSMTKGKEIPIKIMLSLFDSFVSSILSYSCEVWGFIQSVVLERVHRKFLKQLLNVKQSTSNVAIYGEFGRFPLTINFQTRILKYFLKLYSVKANNCILDTVINKMRFDIDTGNNTTMWALNVKNLLQHCGFYDVWLFPESVKIDVFVPLLRRRLLDIYI